MTKPVKDIFWIKCSDKLPEAENPAPELPTDGKLYLVWIPYTDEGYSLAFYDHEDSAWRAFPGWADKIDGVSHWTVLPDPPK